VRKISQIGKTTFRSR